MGNPRKTPGGKDAGVYTADGPQGVYVGQAIDCFRRNEQLSKLGIAWRIVRAMPGSSAIERRAAEREVADALEAAGTVVVSVNTTKAVQAIYRGHTVSEATRAKLSAALRGKKRTPEQCARIVAGRTNRLVSVETRRKMSMVHTGRVHSPATREKIAASKRGRPRSVACRTKISATKRRARERGRFQHDKGLLA